MDTRKYPPIGGKVTLGKSSSRARGGNRCAGCGYSYAFFMMHENSAGRYYCGGCWNGGAYGNKGYKDIDG